MLFIGEDERSAAVEQKFGHLVGFKGGVKGNGHGADGNRSEIGDNPSWPINGEDGAAVAGIDVVNAQPVAYGFSHAAQLGVGIRNDFGAGMRELQLRRNLRRITFSGGEEAAVEALHGRGNMINGSAEKRRFTTEYLQSADELRARARQILVHHGDTEARRKPYRSKAKAKALPFDFARGDRFLEVQPMKPAELRSACTGEPHRPF